MDPEHCLQEESCRHFLHQKDVMATEEKNEKPFYEKLILPINCMSS
jgi:hypothetical protein